MEGLFYNVESGYLEGIVRGYRNTLLTSGQYNNLTQCDTTDDLRVQLGNVYGEFQNLPPNPTTTSMNEKMQENIVNSFRYIRANATGSLAKFCDYLTYGYMIDNVVLLLLGSLHGRDSKDLLERTNPLGRFLGLETLTVATTLEELYNSILIETPLAPYFKGTLSHEDFSELDIEIVRNTLYKYYIEDFHNFVNTDPAITGPTKDIMSEILEFEADRRNINVTVNSIDTSLSTTDRKKLYIDLGRLKPEGIYMLSKAEDLEGVRLAVEGQNDYKSFFDQSGMGGQNGPGNMSGGQDTGKSLEGFFNQREMELCKLAFTQQFSHAIVYAWLKLAENQARSCIWISECIAQNQKDRINDFVAVF